MLRQAFETKQALGGDATIVLTIGNGDDTQRIFDEVWRQTFTFERQFSRFIPESVLSQFNRKAGLAIPISSEFKDILKDAIDMSTRTDGLYNPFILPALQRAGYRRSAMPGYENDTYEDYSSHQVVGTDQLVLKGDTAIIPRGTALDLGGCGKGYLADQLAAFLDRQDLAGYWVSLSGDMVTSGVDEHGNPWHTNVQSAAPSAKLAGWQVVSMGQRLGIATSGTFRRDNHSTLKAHHIINPLTLLPAETDILLATIVAKNALEADVLASCAVMVGSRQAPDFLHKQGILAALLQTTTGDIHIGSLLQHTPAKEKQHA